MIIHVVKQGETLKSISEFYKISPERLILENGITNPDNLVIGQTIVIVYPLVTYTVQGGESLEDIAAKNNTSVGELLRNNPYLTDRELLYPGETIVISYDTKKELTTAISGYTYPFINKDTLKKTLPFLTYLTVLNYQYTSTGDIIDIDDAEIVQMAKANGVAPMMFLSTLTEKGIGSFDTAIKILNSPEIQEKLINNVMNMLKKKGYYGLNIFLKYLRSETKNLVEEYIRKLSNRLKAEGYRLILSITPQIDINGTEVIYNTIDYSTFSELADGILFLSYDWSYSLGPPGSNAPINIVKGILDKVTKSIPSDKLFFGFPVIGYDWLLPYIPGHTTGNAITNDLAIELAALANAEIQYSEIAEAPYFYYTNELNEFHIVWFKDARSIDANSDLVPDYDLQGLSIWNVMRFFAQMWFILNTKFKIDKVESANPPQEIQEKGLT